MTPLCALEQLPNRNHNCQHFLLAICAFSLLFSRLFVSRLPTQGGRESCISLRRGGANSPDVPTQGGRESRNSLRRVGVNQHFVLFLYMGCRFNGFCDFRENCHPFYKKNQVCVIEKSR